MNIEKINTTPPPLTEKPETGLENVEKLSEIEAIEALEVLRNKKENEFLDIEQHNKVMDDTAKTAVEALTYAKDQIHSRREGSLKIETFSEAEGFKRLNPETESIAKHIESIKENAFEVGKGENASVVGYGEELEACYKFAKPLKEGKWRNLLREEARLHNKFFEKSQSLSEHNIGVPEPHYFLSYGNDEVLAMELLNAKSIEDILGGDGFVPEWLDIDQFFEDVENFLDLMHSSGLYHRDMHGGNILISQEDVLNDKKKSGYIIDFGSSKENIIGEDPYVTVWRGETFTTSKDHGKLFDLKNRLANLAKR